MKAPLAVVALIVCAPAALAAQSPQEGAIAAVHRLFDGMRTADSAKVRSVFADGARFASVDARVSPSTVRFDPVDDWIAAIAASKGRWDEQIYDVRVSVDDNIAHVWAPYTFYLDGAVRHCGVNTIELLMVNGDWKITQVSDTRRRENCPDPLTPR